MLIGVDIVDSRRVENPWNVLDVISIILVEKPRVIESLIEPLIADVAPEVPNEIPMPELSFVFPLHFHVFPLVNSFIGVNSALLITDGMVVLVSVNFVPGSLE